MPHTNRDGRDLKQFLQYILNRDLSEPEYYSSWDGSHAKYYAKPTPRQEKDDFPNAEELRLVAHAFGLEFFNLLVEFGLAPATEEFPGYSTGPDAGPLALVTKRKEKTKTRRFGGNPNIRGKSL